MSNYNVTDNGIDFPSRTSDPSTLVEGTMWHRSDLNEFHGYLNGSVQSINFDSGSLTTFSAGIAFGSSASLTPPTITGDTDDYNPTGFIVSGTIAVSLLLLSSNNDLDLRGLMAPPDGKENIIYIDNVGTKKIKLKKEDGSSSAANRFDFKDDWNLDRDRGGCIYYNQNVNRYRLIAKV